MREAMISQQHIQRAWLNVIVIGALFSGALYEIPKCEVPRAIHDKEKRFVIEDRARQTLAQIMAGGFFLATAYFTWRTVRATEENVAIAQRNLKIVEDNAQQNRRLELHKIAFSDKFNAASAIMMAIASLSREVDVYFYTHVTSPNDDWHALHEKLRNLSQLLDVNFWIFDASIIEASRTIVSELGNAIMQVDQANADKGHHPGAGITPASLAKKQELHEKFKTRNHALVANLAHLMRDEMKIHSFS